MSIQSVAVLKIQCFSFNFTRLIIKNSLETCAMDYVEVNLPEENVEPVATGKILLIFSTRLSSEYKKIFLLMNFYLVVYILLLKIGQFI